MSVDRRDDAVDRLRAGAGAIPPAGVDAGAALADSKRALRRRRGRQSVGGAAVAAVLVVGLSGVPLRLPGVGTLVYSRGAFSDDGKCAGRSEEQPFDAAARADLSRILAAVNRSAAPTDELTAVPAKAMKVAGRSTGVPARASRPVDGHGA
jgi:hypothetical protein